MTVRPYLFDAELKIWVTSSHDGTSYSDGDTVEGQLLSALKQCRNVSIASEELRAHITDWPTEYHFSSVRHNLLRPFTLGPSDSILELGCGCGAMTRYLGETGAKVVAVEGSRRRAAIAAERCRDLPNVSVYCDNLIDFQANATFDFVTLIGVLEYSNQFISGPDSIQACLEKTGSFLTENGTLILAIENQLGLKYLNGSNEDHIGVPFFGVNDLYSEETPVTYGKHELETRLNEADFTHVTFYYPFPDYKLPSIILAEEAFHQKGFQTADLLFRTFSRDYGSRSLRSFHENMAWQPLARNQIVQDLANSFLVIAHKKPQPNQRKAKWLGSIYSTGRLPSFATRTDFLFNGVVIEVSKERLYPEFPPEYTKDSRFFHQPQRQAAYVYGRLYATELQPVLAKGGGIPAVVHWAAPWVNHIVAAAVPGPNTTMVLPAIWLDAIPTNMVKNRSGNLIAIDLEWKADTQVPLNWVLIRGLVYALSSCPLSPALADLTFRDAVSKTLQQIGRTLSNDDFQIASVLEDILLNMVCGPNTLRSSFFELLNGPIYSTIYPTTFQQEISLLQNELARVKATVSWRVTQPLRLMATIARFIRNIFLRRRRPNY